MCAVGQREAEDFVSQDGTSVCKSKETVVSEYCSQAHSASMEHGFMAQGRESLWEQPVNVFIVVV